MNDPVKNKICLPAEWAPHSGVQLTFPHADTDWSPYLDETIRCFAIIAREVSKREQLLVVARDPEAVTGALVDCNMANVRIAVADSDDTWARDHGGITIIEDGLPVMCDFRFNGWGNKFKADRDNRITGLLFEIGAFSPQVSRRDHLNFVLEGGSIESDGEGTLLTTSECLLSKERNPHMTQKQIEAFLMQTFGASRVLWLNNGYLAGDDTDSHIDTLARFCDPHTIAYVRCDDESDIHYESLFRMEAELKRFKTANGAPYRLIPLPMADEMQFDGERLPATYANFLIINGAVLVPTYNSVTDERALTALSQAFPKREIVGIDCSVLVKQHGSLHCVTMQYPTGVLSQSEQ